MAGFNKAEIKDCEKQLDHLREKLERKCDKAKLEDTNLCIKSGAKCTPSRITGRKPVISETCAQRLVMASLGLQQTSSKATNVHIESIDSLQQKNDKIKSKNFNSKCKQRNNMNYLHGVKKLNVKKVLKNNSMVNSAELSLVKPDSINSPTKSEAVVGENDDGELIRAKQEWLAKAKAAVLKKKVPDFKSQFVKLPKCKRIAFHLPVRSMHSSRHVKPNKWLLNDAFSVSDVKVNARTVKFASVQQEYEDGSKIATVKSTSNKQKQKKDKASKICTESETNDSNALCVGLTNDHKKDEKKVMASADILAIKTSSPIKSTSKNINNHISKNINNSLEHKNVVSEAPIPVNVIAGFKTSKGPLLELPLIMEGKRERKVSIKILSRLREDCRGDKEKSQSVSGASALNTNTETNVQYSKGILRQPTLRLNEEVINRSKAALIRKLKRQMNRNKRRGLNLYQNNDASKEQNLPVHPAFGIKPSMPMMSAKFGESEAKFLGMN